MTIEISLNQLVNKMRDQCCRLDHKASDKDTSTITYFIAELETTVKVSITHILENNEDLPEEAILFSGYAPACRDSIALTVTPPNKVVVNKIKEYYASTFMEDPFGMGLPTSAFYSFKVNGKAV